MPKSRALEDTLVAIGELRKQPVTSQSLDTLRQALHSKVSHVAAKAAQVIGELELHQLATDLPAAFDRFMINPVKSDPRCGAKIDIARALYQIGDGDPSLFVRGIRHQQLEPVYGGKEDTAPELRSVCALGLVRFNYPDAMVELAELLADPEPAARSGAARAIAYSEDDHGIPLLRLKVLTGDEPQVLSDCFAALLSLAPSSSLPFVARYLDDADGTLNETAAVAIGASRLPEALDVLRQWWDRTSATTLRRTALLAIAMLRYDQALEFLMSTIAAGRGSDARDAVAALAMYRHDDHLRARVEHTIAERTDVDLRATFAEAF